MLTSIITAYAGNGISGFSGDNGPATSAQIEAGFTFWDKFGNMYIGDSARIRKVDASGIITTIAGNSIGGCEGDSGLAALANVNENNLCTDSHGNVYLTADSCISVRKINISTGIITRIAGDTDKIAFPYSGDGLLALNSHIDPSGVAVDDTGNVYIADYANQRIEKIDTFGIIHTVAGTGLSGFSGDNGPADSAKISYPENVVLDKCGNLYIMDFNNKRVRKVTFDTSCHLCSADTNLRVNTITSNSSSINIYPNPAHNTIIVTSPNKINNIAIINMLGQVVYSLSMHGEGRGEVEKVEVDVSNYPGGVYFVKVNGVYVQKVLKE